MNAVTHIEHRGTIPSTVSEMLFNDAAFARIERIANIMASGKSTIPAHLRGSSGDCFAVLLQAARWKMDPYAVAQKTFLVNGVLGYEAQLIAAVINSSNEVQDRFHFEWFGDWTKVIGKFDIRKGDKGEYRVPGWKLADEEGLGVRVWATLRRESEPRELELLLAQARTRNSTLWADDPKQQLAYLAQKRWARLYCPDVILGVYTPDELDTTPERDITPPSETQQTTTIKDKLRQRIWKPSAVTVLDRITSARTLEELDAVKDDAAGLPENERTAARQRFSERRAELKRNAVQPCVGDQAACSETVDTDTGEIIEPEPAAVDTFAELRANPEYADWCLAVDDCKTTGDLSALINTMDAETKSAMREYMKTRQSAIKLA